jgi:site-specific recombinase XerD
LKIVKDKKLFDLIKEYFTEYLPNQRRYSPHTVRNYQVAIEMFLDFLKQENHVKLSNVTFEMINKQSVKKFLSWLESERKTSVTTRNHRLACIRSFLTFASDADTLLVPLADEVSRVKSAKVIEKTIVTYLSEKAIKTILATPDSSTKKGIRDRMMLIMLYDTGARIQELLDIKLNDLHLKGSPIVTVTGKRNKTRNVSLLDTTVRHLKKYLDIFHHGKQKYENDYLFYTTHTDGNKRMTEDNARKFIKGYGVFAKQQCSEIPDDIHPHLFRHSRAMHLYQHGMPLPIISKWLGHTEIETTQIYATADTEMKRKAIEAATPEDSPLRQYVNARKYTINDDDMIKQLYGLKQ